MNKKILISKIVSAHGIKGEVKLLFFGDNPKNLEKYSLFDAKNNQYKIKLGAKNLTSNSPRTSSSQSLVAKIALANQDWIDDRSHAEELKGLELYALRDDFAKTKRNEFYVADLVGLEVLNNAKQKIGIITNVHNFSAVANIEIEFLDDFIPRGFQKIDNFPFKNDFFPVVEIVQGYLVFEAPEMV